MELDRATLLTRGVFRVVHALMDEPPTHEFSEFHQHQIQPKPNVNQQTMSIKRQSQQKSNANQKVMPTLI